MKKIFLLSLLVLFLSTASFAQVSNGSFTMVEGVTFTDVLGANGAYENTVHVRNDKSTDLSIGWRQITHMDVNNWAYQLCDHEQCIILPASNTYTPSSIRPEAEGFFKVQIYSDASNMGMSQMEFLVWDVADSANTATTLSWTLNPNVSVTPEQFESNISVYPTLVHDRVSVSANEGLLEKGTLSLMDLNGRVLVRKTVTAVKTTDLNLNDVSEGVYLLRYQAGDAVMTRKLVKQ